MLSIGAGSAIRSLLLGIGGISGLMFMLGDRLVGEGTGRGCRELRRGGLGR